MTQQSSNPSITDMILYLIDVRDTEEPIKLNDWETTFVTSMENHLERYESTVGLSSKQVTVIEKTYIKAKSQGKITR